MSKKIYVGNLSWSASEDDLRGICAEFGNVTSVKIVMDNMTGRSRGFGFVEFETEESASAAATGLNGVSLQDRQLKVDLARESNDRAPRGGGGGGGGFRGGGDRGGFRGGRGGGGDRGGDRGGRGGGGDRGGYRGDRGNR